jgi:hypothetical protein
LTLRTQLRGALLGATLFSGVLAAAPHAAKAAAYITHAEAAQPVAFDVFLNGFLFETSQPVAGIPQTASNP